MSFYDGIGGSYTECDRQVDDRLAKIFVVLCVFGIGGIPLLAVIGLLVKAIL